MVRMIIDVEMIEELKSDNQYLYNEFNKYCYVAKTRVPIHDYGDLQEALLNAERIFYYKKLTEIEEILLV